MLIKWWVAGQLAGRLIYSVLKQYLIEFVYFDFSNIHTALITSLVRAKQAAKPLNCSESMSGKILEAQLQKLHIRWKFVRLNFSNKSWWHNFSGIQHGEKVESQKLRGKYLSKKISRQEVKDPKMSPIINSKQVVSSRQDST